MYDINVTTYIYTYDLHSLIRYKGIVIVIGRSVLSVYMQSHFSMKYADEFKI